MQRARRQPVKTYMKTMIKKMVDLVSDKKIKEATDILPETYKAIDMAAKRQIIHKKTAARKKSFVANLVATKAK